MHCHNLQFCFPTWNARGTWFTGIWTVVLAFAHKSMPLQRLDQSRVGFGGEQPSHSNSTCNYGTLNLDVSLTMSNQLTSIFNKSVPTPLLFVCLKTIQPGPPSPPTYVAVCYLLWIAGGYTWLLLLHPDWGGEVEGFIELCDSTLSVRYYRPKILFSCKKRPKHLFFYEYWSISGWQMFIFYVFNSKL